MHYDLILKIINFLSYCIRKNEGKYCETVYDTSGKNLIWSIKYSGVVLNNI